jgi:choline-glycine betaine transporter
MIFSSGVGNVLLVGSVAQPLFFQNDHYYANAGYRSQDEKDMFAITMAITNWGFCGWATFLVVTLCMALAGHRFQLPMTYRSCFYPILGAYTWGWMGDVLDGLFIVVCLVLVFSGVGMGVLQIVAGMIYMGWLESESAQLGFYVTITLWTIIILSIISVVSGLHGGTPMVAQIAMALASFLAFVVFAIDDSKYVLNLSCQAAGTYLQMGTFQLNFWTEAFGQLREGSGRSVDGLSAEQWWMEAWNTFSQAWT